VESVWDSCIRFAVSSWFGHLWSTFLHPVPSRGLFRNPVLELATFVSHTVTFCLRPYSHVFSLSIQHILVDCPGYSCHQSTNVSPSTNVSEILCEMLESSPSDEPLVVSTVRKLLYPTFFYVTECAYSARRMYCKNTILTGGRSEQLERLMNP
jgi:hypothetical protein